MRTNDIKVTPQWSKNKDEIWNARFAVLDEEPSVKTNVLKKRRVTRYVAAAAVVVFLVLPSVAFFYSKEITASRGEHLSVVLPDGSAAELNAESRIRFKPLWWTVARKAEISGEVYFEAEPGRRFTVESGHGEVTVLGTSFNIYDRNGNYDVTCLSGKVGVSSAGGSVILASGMSARYGDGRLTVYDDRGADLDAGWRAGKFRFESAPLTDVIAEVERQYDIKVIVPGNMDYLYSGYFTRDQSPEQVLEIIGKPFGITFRIE